MSDNIVGLFGTTSSGKTVYLVSLYNYLRTQDTGFALDFTEQNESLRYLQYLTTQIFGKYEFPPSTISGEIKKVFFNVIKDVSEDIVETLFSFQTYDFSGEDMVQIFSPQLSTDGAGGIQLKDINLKIEESDILFNVKNEIDKLIDRSSSFMFMVDPNPANKYSQENFIYAILMQIIDVHRKKYNLKKNQRIKDVSIAFVLTKSDEYPQNSNVRQQLVNLIGLAYNFANVRFNRKRIGTFEISSLGVKPEKKIDEQSGYEYQIVPKNTRPRNIMEPIKFFREQLKQEIK